MSNFAGIIVAVAIICFSGGAFVMETWHAETSAVNTIEIAFLKKQMLELEKRQLDFMNNIQEHNIIEAEYMAELQLQLESIKNDIGGM